MILRALAQPMRPYLGECPVITTSNYLLEYLIIWLEKFFKGKYGRETLIAAKIFFDPGSVEFFKR